MQQVDWGSGQYVWTGNNGLRECLRDIGSVSTRAMKYQVAEHAGLEMLMLHAGCLNLLRTSTFEF